MLWYLQHPYFSINLKRKNNYLLTVKIINFLRTSWISSDITLLTIFFSETVNYVPWGTPDDPENKLQARTGSPWSWGPNESAPQVGRLNFRASWTAWMKWRRQWRCFSLRMGSGGRWTPYLLRSCRYLSISGQRENERHYGVYYVSSEYTERVNEKAQSKSFCNYPAWIKEY